MYYKELNKKARDNAREKGIEVTELRAIGAGGYMRPQDKHLLDEAYAQNEAEREEWLKDPDNLVVAFKYELANHEYCVTYDDAMAWAAVGLSMKDSTKAQLEAFVKARELYLGSVIY